MVILGAVKEEAWIGSWPPSHPRLWRFGPRIFRSLDRGLAAFPSLIMAFWSANIQKLYVLRSAL